MRILLPFRICNMSDGSSAPAPGMTNRGSPQAEDGSLEPSRIVSIRMRDGIKIAAALYLPRVAGRVPALLAASPYRFDNNIAPAVPIFLWRETGPIDWYLEQGYAFVHMDVRGTGRSGGDYRYMCREEQRDLVEVIEWIARQRWCNGRVGGIGQSYYARMQWFMAIQNPPHLAAIAPYDGNVDTYRASAYTGGIPGHFRRGDVVQRHGAHRQSTSCARTIASDRLGLCLGRAPASDLRCVLARARGGRAAR